MFVRLAMMGFVPTQIFDSLGSLAFAVLIYVTDVQFMAHVMIDVNRLLVLRDVRSR